jgi:hypothetical protein
MVEPQTVLGGCRELRYVDDFTGVLNINSNNFAFVVKVEDDARLNLFGV